MTSMDPHSRRVLLVDDDPLILGSLQRAHGRRFHVHTACGGPAGLRALERDGPFAVVVADNRMPLVDGLEVLDEARRISPDTTRIMLTGETCLEAAMAAVNRGSVFRFLTKPCAPQDVAAAIEDGIELYQLRQTEHLLLERTLNGAIQVCIDLLSLANPPAFARAKRLHRLMARLARQLGVANRWQYEIAALLSQVGHVALSHATSERVERGEPLELSELNALEAHTELAREMLASVPRLEVIAAILDRWQHPARPATCAEAETGARLLMAVADFDALTREGRTPEDAVAVMKSCEGRYDRGVLAAMEWMGLEFGELATRQVGHEELEDGWFFADDVVAASGETLWRRGEEVTPQLRARLGRLVLAGDVDASAAFLVAESRVLAPA